MSIHHASLIRAIVVELLDPNGATWTAVGYLRWFRNGMKYYAPKELVIEHLMSEDFRTITGKSKKHRWIISQLNERTSKEGDGNE